jgi:hypothetical protein
MEGRLVPQRTKPKRVKELSNNRRINCFPIKAQLTLLVFCTLGVGVLAGTGIITQE